MTYDTQWLVIGLVLLLLIAGWLVFVLFITRKKPQKTIASLPAKPYVPPDLTALKQKYLALIAKVEQDYAVRACTARTAHQSLSRLLRVFVYEVNGHRLDAFTLSDLRRSRYASLAAAVESYYVPEFGRVEQGSVATAVQTAKQVVTQWA